MHVLELEMERLKLELILIMNALQTRIKATSQLTSKCLQILADQVIWHMLDDDREPFIDFALASTRFIKHEAGDGSTVNILEIGMVQGFNLQEGAKYPQLLGPDINEEKKKLDSCHNEKPIISMSWTVLNAVGGIPIIKNAKLETQRLQLELEYATAKNLKAICSLKKQIPKIPMSKMVMSLMTYMLTINKTACLIVLVILRCQVTIRSCPAKPTKETYVKEKQ